MTHTFEKKLCDAALKGRVSDVSSLLKDHPDLDVNWEVSQSTPLHRASKNGHVEIVKLLLAHPVIHVNVKNNYGETPFSLACLNGFVGVVCLMLKDPRVDVALDDEGGRTPLWWATCYGECDVVEWLIASGRNIGDVNKKKGKFMSGQEYTALEVARENQKTDIVPVLERFRVNSTQTQYELRVTLGLLDELAADVFTLTVFLSDGFLQLKPAPSSSNQTSATAAAAAAFHFFTVASKLPMELQMILCRRAVGSMKQNILRNDSNVAFQSLARVLLLPPSRSN